MSQDNVYESELTASREEIAAVLSGIADGLLAGDIRVGDDADGVTVPIPDEVRLEIELETEDDESSLELELEWPVHAGDAAISSAESASEKQPADDGAVLVGAADDSQSLARFEVFRDRREEWRWRLRHRNGNIIATSGEGYTRKHNAWKGLRSVMENSPDAAVTEDSTR